MPDPACLRCGRRLPRARGASDGSLCKECTQFAEPVPGAGSSTVAGFLLQLIAPGMHGLRFSPASVFVLGVVTFLVGGAFGALGVVAFLNPEWGLPPQFAYGMLGLSAPCLLGALACFVPRSRWWVIPALAVIIGV